MKINIRGYNVLIDDEDYEKVMAHNWFACKPSKLVYFHYSKRLNGKRYHYSLHRFLLNAPKGGVVDHINGNTLDNRKENLRITDWQGNARNHGISCTNTSGYRGVIYSKQKNRWRAVLQTKNNPLHLGYYPTKEIASYVYEEAAKIVFGEFYRDLNISSEIIIPTWHIAPCKAEKNGRGWFTKIKYNSYPHYLSGYKTEEELQEAYKKMRAEIDIKKSLENASRKIRKLMGSQSKSEKIDSLAIELKPEEREPVQFTCKKCGKVFYSMKPHSKFCTKKCGNIYRHKEYLYRYNHKCELCGKDFVGNKRRRFCSRKCSSQKVIQRGINL